MDFVYFIASAVLGVGIAVDVAIVTIGRYRLFSNRQVAMRWVLMISATHIIFPMIGYYGLSGAVRAYPEISIFLGLGATALIGYILLTAFREWMEEAEDEADGEASGGAAVATVSWALILAVSWDALLSGPAKAAQAVGWSPIEVLFSFFIAGFVVATVAAAATWLASAVARRLERQQITYEKIALQQVWGLFWEFSFIGYFGVLAFARYVVRSEVSSVILFFGWAFCVGVFVFMWRKPLILASYNRLLAYAKSQGAPDAE